MSKYEAKYNQEDLSDELKDKVKSAYPNDTPFILDRMVHYNISGMDNLDNFLSRAKRPILGLPATTIVAAIKKAPVVTKVEKSSRKRQKGDR